MKTMNISNIISLLRIPLSLLFCLLLVHRPYIPGLWILFALIELSDFLDGFVARKSNSATEAGKLIDPAADVLSRLSIFFAYAFLGKIHFFVALLLFYREVSMTSFRAIMAKRDRIIGANWLGKLKTNVYALTIGLVLLSFSVDLGIIPLVSSWVAVVLAYISFISYVLPRKVYDSTD